MLAERGPEPVSGVCVLQIREDGGAFCQKRRTPVRAGGRGFRASGLAELGKPGRDPSQSPPLHPARPRKPRRRTEGACLGQRRILKVQFWGRLGHLDGRSSPSEPVPFLSWVRSCSLNLAGPREGGRSPVFHGPLSPKPPSLPRPHRARPPHALPSSPRPAGDPGFLLRITGAAFPMPPSCPAP